MKQTKWIQTIGNEESWKEIVETHIAYSGSWEKKNNYTLYNSLSNCFGTIL